MRLHDIEKAKEYCKTVEYPIIVKASDLTAGNGTMKAAGYDEACMALEYSFSRSRNKKILIEQYINGTQHSYCVFLLKGKVVAESTCQSYSFQNPYFVQAETFPSREVIGVVKKELKDVVESMAADLNLVDGILCLQLMMEDGKPYIIDVMRRTFGNEALSLHKRSSGFDWDKAYLLSSLGKDCSHIKGGQPAKDYCGHYSIMAPKNGTLKVYYLNEDVNKHVYKKVNMMIDGQEITDYQVCRKTPAFRHGDIRRQVANFWRI